MDHTLLMDSDFVVGNGFVSSFLYKLLQVGTRNEDSDVILTHTDRLDNMETNFGLALGATPKI